MNKDRIKEIEEVIHGDYANTMGLLVSKNGETMYERYFNGCAPGDTIHFFSVTKSIVSILIGIALDKGCIGSVDQKVLDFFPDYTIKRCEKTIQKITLENLLTMTAPYKYRSAPYTKYFTSEDWVKAALDLLGGKGEIGRFRYTPLIGPDILSGILVNATGKSVLEFASEHLFEPLEISVKGNVTFSSKEEQFAYIKAKSASGWVADPKGVNTAGWGLAMTAVDMAKIGQLYLQDGNWRGRQIVSSSWVERSIKEHSRWEEMNLRYGYLWWLIDNRERSFAAMGDGGNVIYVNPQKGLVVASTALFNPRAKDRIELIKKYIEPAFVD